LTGRIVRRAGAVLVCAFAVGLPAIGCAWVTDAGANGYTLREGGAPRLGCTSAADCDGGTVCCATSMSPFTASCAKSCPGLPVTLGVQLCASDTECANGTCVQQECFNVMVAACGLVSECSQSDDGGSADTSVPVVSLDASSTTD
jgi:hypothetical protein